MPTEFHSENLFTAMKSAALTVSGAAISSNATFPYVTVPAFEILGQTTRAQSGIEFLLFTPLVNESTKDDWGPYTEKNQGWIEESRKLALTSGEATVFSSDYSMDPIKPYLFEYDLEKLEIEPTTKPPFFPIWQMSPCPFDPSHIVNFNRASKPFFESHLSSVMGSGEGTMSPVFNPKVLANWAIKDEDHDAYHAQFVQNAEASDPTSAFERPHCGFMQPVFRDLYDPNVWCCRHHASRSTVGSLSGEPAPGGSLWYIDCSRKHMKSDVHLLLGREPCIICGRR